ncbi:hypothetical protein ACWEA7_40505, partial [Streptomyces sp. NPDC005093]
MTPRQSRPTHLANLDLNLLVTLRALLRERNVTRAARNLGVTVCAAAERLFATGTAFDPATTQREFTLLMADYPATVLGPALSRLFDSDAPHAALHLQLVRETLGSGAGDTIRLVDGLVSRLSATFVRVTNSPSRCSGRLAPNRATRNAERVTSFMSA